MAPPKAIETTSAAPTIASLPANRGYGSYLPNAAHSAPKAAKPANSRCPSSPPTTRTTAVASPTLIAGAMVASADPIRKAARHVAPETVCAMASLE